MACSLLRTFPFGSPAVLTPFPYDDRATDHHDRGNHPADPNVALNGVQEGEIVAQHVAQGAIGDRPHNSTRGIEYQTPRPGHTVGSRQECRPGAQHGNEAPKKDGLVAMLPKEFLRTVEVLGLQPDVSPIASGEIPTTKASRCVAQIVADDGSSCSRNDDPAN